MHQILFIISENRVSSDDESFGKPREDEYGEEEESEQHNPNQAMTKYFHLNHKHLCQIYVIKLFFYILTTFLSFKIVNNIFLA